MRCFEARQLLREIGCALAKAHNVIHLKGGVALTHCDHPVCRELDDSLRRGMGCVRSLQTIGSFCERAVACARVFRHL